VIVVIAARTGGVFLSNFAESSTFAVFLMYAVPLGLAVTATLMVLSGNQLRPPEKIVAASEAAFARASGLFSGRPQAAAGGRS
jgi:hypothetical protein